VNPSTLGKGFGSSMNSPISNSNLLLYKLLKQIIDLSEYDNKHLNFKEEGFANLNVKVGYVSNGEE
jgi:hypothetical protein